ELNKPSINHAENIAEAPRFDGLKTDPRSRRSLKWFRQNHAAAFQARHPADAHFPDFIISKKLNDLPGGWCGNSGPVRQKIAGLRRQSPYRPARAIPGQR